MDGIQQTNPQGYINPPARAAAGTSFVEGMGGLAAVALSVVGLAHIHSYLLVSIAVIVLGTALLFEAGAIAARSTLIRERVPEVSLGHWAGIASCFMGGVAGIALGILSILGIKMLTLVPVAAIVFGGILILDSGVNARLNAAEFGGAKYTSFGESIMQETAMGSSGLQVLAGLSAITLGVLALVGINPLALSLIAMLTVGSALLLSGSVAGTRVLNMMRSKA